MRFIFILLLVVTLSTVKGQTVNYSEHIASIIYKHCTTCHRPGEIGPFSLTNYSEVSSFGNMIKYVTGIQYMPPWKPEKGIQHYQKENFLSDQDISLIAQWVDEGMIQGDPSKEPELPVFPTGSQIGTPDLVVSFAQNYIHKGTGIDEYRYFVIPTNLAEDKDLVALEIRPGNKKIVHHTLVWADTTGNAAAADAATPEYGYEGTGSSAAGQLNNQLPGYVPGQKPIVYRDGLAMNLPKHSDLLLQMHYAPTFSDEADSTSINLFFSKVPSTRYVETYVMLPVPGILQNDIFVIPANQVKKFHGKLTLPTAVTFLGIAPHCHLLGKNWEVYAIKPNGDTVRIINIPDWDFNWQGSFHLKKPIILPAGSQIHAFATYDNTSNNPNNPNSPPKFVTWGENTSDEMYYLPLIYMAYRSGDENLYFDDDVLSNKETKYFSVSNKIYPIFPNPSQGNVSIPFTLSESAKVDIKLFDSNGRFIQSVVDQRMFYPGMHNLQFDGSKLLPGNYQFMILINNAPFSQKWMKN